MVILMIGNIAMSFYYYSRCCSVLFLHTCDLEGLPFPKFKWNLQGALSVVPYYMSYRPFEGHKSSALAPGRSICLTHGSDVRGEA